MEIQWFPPGDQLTVDRGRPVEILFLGKQVGLERLRWEVSAALRQYRGPLRQPRRDRHVVLDCGEIFSRMLKNSVFDLIRHT